MEPFRRKSVGTADTLGERLRSLREEAGFSVEDVAARIGVNAKHIQALEEGRYSDLPGKVYAKSFVRIYAQFVNVREETALNLFEREYVVVERLTPPPPTPPSKPIRTGAILTPHHIRRGFILLLALGILVYLGVEIRNLTSAPFLSISSPPEQLTTGERSVELSGRTDPETTVTANGRPILVDREGSFREVLDLQDGLNTIIIRAEKKRGTATTITRKILVETQ